MTGRGRSLLAGRQPCRNPRLGLEPQAVGGGCCQDVAWLHVQGGSILRTSRANPTVRDEGAADPDWRLTNCMKALRELGIGALVTIGGDDTAFSAARLSEAAGGALRVAHVPKTIDN